ncbi:efflux RND transporter permease subunit [Polycyclovorans algicola]|uniref:efflux RND transporter permease subunit n=1 Tax=Polycyclovorans algicola TaxID=616992 RepID=UPI0005B82875|nr:MMPL family transporter [Polycyclovorans algicola]
MKKLPAPFRLAKWIMDRRLAVGIAFLLVTAGFAAGLPGVEIRTIFKDLLPKDDPFVQVYYDHPNFGNPLTVFVMVKRVDGDIYNTDTLQLVWDLTRNIDLTPAVDHDQMISISTEKLRYVEATPEGVDVRPLMGDEVPTTDQAIEEFKRRVEQSPNARNFYVSQDGTATLIQATFQDYVDYGVAFNFIRDLVSEADDENHDIFVAGQPTLTGWVYELRNQTYTIFAITLSMLVVALALYMRNLAGTITPVICSAVAAIWGFGLVGWLKSPIEPLLMIVPLLLIARSFSHCVQFSERFYEIYAHLKDKRKAAEVTMGVMMMPSILGVITDGLGIVFIAVAPISAMERFALFCGFWAFCIIPTGVFLISILLSYLPDPKNIDSLVASSSGDGGGGFHAAQKRVLKKVSRLSYGNPAKITTVVVAIFSAIAIFLSFQIKIGNPVEGSNLLWEDSEFNTAVRAVNNHFPGMNTLELIIESKDPADGTNRVALSHEAMLIRAKLQAIVEADEVLPPRATLSFTDYMMEGNRLFSGGNPKWMPIDPTSRAAYSAGQAVLFGSTPLNFSNVMDFEAQHSTVSMWYADNKQDTVDAALASAQRAVDLVETDHEKFTVRMGTGFIALQQAMNLVVSRYHWIILGLLNLAIFVVATYAYRSWVGALIVLIPVNLSNFVLTATMHVMGIGLDINSVMVAVLGVGVGIDYGIYLLSRICEEFNVQGKDWGKAISVSLMTTGKAIMFTATIMIIGILPWYFLSDLKFMADMGLLLVAIMLINMVLALVVLPLLVWLIKPKFASREDLMVGESVDLSLFMDKVDEKGNVIPATH